MSSSFGPNGGFLAACLPSGSSGGENLRESLADPGGSPTRSPERTLVRYLSGESQPDEQADVASLERELSAVSASEHLMASIDVA